MASDRSSAASVFDDLLNRNRQQFDELYRGQASAPARTTPIARQEAAPQAATGSVRILNDRYGSAWRHQIVERRREGDEAIVLCRLEVGTQDPPIVRSQFGRGRIIAAGGQLAGRSGGLAFSLGGGTRSAGPNDPEAAAFQRAEEAALAKCIELL